MTTTTKQTETLTRGDVIPGPCGGIVSHVEHRNPHPTVPSIDRRIVFTDGRGMSAESAGTIRVAVTS